MKHIYNLLTILLFSKYFPILITFNLWRFYITYQMQSIFSFPLNRNHYHLTISHTDFVKMCKCPSDYKY